MSVWAGRRTGQRINRLPPQTQGMPGTIYCFSELDLHNALTGFREAAASDPSRQSVIAVVIVPAPRTATFAKAGPNVPVL